jgi:hypothetical protein
VVDVEGTSNKEAEVCAREVVKGDAGQGETKHGGAPARGVISGWGATSATLGSVHRLIWDGEWYLPSGLNFGPCPCNC